MILTDEWKARMQKDLSELRGEMQKTGHMDNYLWPKNENDFDFIQYIYQRAAQEYGVPREDAILEALEDFSYRPCACSLKPGSGLTMDEEAKASEMLSGWPACPEQEIAAYQKMTLAASFA